MFCGINNLLLWLDSDAQRSDTMPSCFLPRKYRCCVTMWTLAWFYGIAPKWIKSPHALSCSAIRPLRAQRAQCVMNTQHVDHLSFRNASHAVCPTLNVDAMIFLKYFCLTKTVVFVKILCAVTQYCYFVLFYQSIAPIFIKDSAKCNH